MRACTTAEGITETTLKTIFLGNSFSLLDPKNQMHTYRERDMSKYKHTLPHDDWGFSI